MLIPAPIRADRLVLRNLGSADASPTYLQWMNDPDVLRFLEARHARSDLHGLRQFIDSCNNADDTLLLGICEADGRHVGNIKLGPIEGVHGAAAVGILIGERDCWGRGYATEAVRALTRYAFDGLGLGKLYAGCYASNVGSERAFVRAGWAVEGRQRARWILDGHREDNVMFGCARGEWN